MAEHPKALISRVALEKPVEIEIAPGASVQEVLDAADIPEAVLPHIVTMLNGIEVTDRENVWLVEDDQLAILVMPAGGGAKDILRLVAVIAVAVAAPYLAGAMGFTAGTTAYAVATAGITLVGTMAVNALIPPAPLSIAGGEQSDPTFWFNGSSNQMRPYQRVPIAYGDVRMYAAALAQPVIFNFGAKSEFTGLYDFGLGNAYVFDVKIGDTPLHVARGEHVHHTQQPKLFNTSRPELGYNPVPLQLMRVPTASMPLTYGYTDDTHQFAARTRPDTLSAIVEMAFPSGLVEFKDNGDEERRAVTFKIEVKRASEPVSAYRKPDIVRGYDGDHLYISGDTIGQPPADLTYPQTVITIDPHNRAFRDANNNIILTPTNDRITIRIEFDRPVYGFGMDTTTESNNDLQFNPVPGAFNALTFDRTPVNPDGFLVVANPGAPADGVLVVDSVADGGVRIIELEFTAKAGALLSGIQPKLDTGKLNNAPPVSGGQPFDSYWFYAQKAFSIDMVNTVPDPGTPPSNPDTPAPDDTEYYNATVGNETWIRYVEYAAIVGTWLVEDGSGEFKVNGATKPVTTMQVYEMRGTVMRREKVSGISFTDRYEVWAAVKREYL